MATSSPARCNRARRLYLRPPIVEHALDGQDAAYRFEYTGLKLLFRTRGTFFLRPSNSAVSTANIVIAEGPDLRFEFSRSGES